MTNVTPETWAATLLNRLGIRQTPGAVKALVGWERAEGGNWNNSARYNPLNTTQSMPGYQTFHSVGAGAADIGIYNSWDQGLSATVKTLRNGRYGGILSALKAGDPNAVANAIGASPWGTSSGLVHSAIGGTHVGGGVQPVAGLAGGGGGGAQASGRPAAASVAGGAPTLGDPGQAGDFSGLVSSLLSQQAKPSTPSISALPAPSFAAAPALPQAYTQLAPVGAPAPPAQDRVQAGLSLVGALGGTEATAGSSNSLAGPQTAPSASTGAPSSGGPAPARTPKLVTFDGKQVAGWIAPILQRARATGLWKGTVSSGYRSDAEQTRIYNSGVRPAAKPKSEGGSGSNHEGAMFPLGAVDVSDAPGLAAALKKLGVDKLQYAGSKDPVHFSHPHDGGY